MKRVAVLFGNNDYLSNPLINAVNDAKCLSEKLTELNFNTYPCYNININEMDKNMADFADNLKEADVGLFFFAGHGIQVKGENFLATIDTSFVDQSSCKRTSYALNEVIAILDESNVSTKIIILDACRDNPFPSSWRGNSIEGLAPVYAPKGTIIAFATSPGQKASDGKGSNGVYTNALLTHIGTKKISIEDMFKRVRNTVSAQTNNKQITWEHTSLMGTFYFNSGYDTGIFTTAYSEKALVDKNFIFDSDNDLKNIVEALQSYDWYTQNPAIRRLNELGFSDVDIDELFILGRNIYQAACGGAWVAKDWIDNLENNLNKFSDSIEFHILNGILFEIYFDNCGKLRRLLKSELYETPVSLCNKEKYTASASFISNKLILNPQRIIYLPGSDDTILLDIGLEITDDNQYQLTQIYIDGLPCLYNEDSSDLYSYDVAMYLYQLTKSQFEYLIKSSLAVPKNKIQICYNLKISEECIINSPNQLNLANYGN